MNTDIFVYRLLHNAHQAAKKSFASDLEPTQYLVLRAIMELGDGSIQRHLIHATGVDRSTMTDTLRRLQRKGLITRRRSAKDTRSIEVRLTNDGRKAVLRATEAAAAANAMILGVIPESQRRAFLANLERIGKGPVQAVREAA